MTKVTVLSQGLHVSISTLAAEFGVTRETAARRIADSGVQPSGKRGGYPVYRLKEVWSAVLGRLPAGEDGEDPEQLRPFERRAHYQAELEKLTLATKRGELVPSFEVEQRFGEMLKAVGEMLDTLPDILERDCGASALMLDRIEKRLDELRNVLYAKLTEDEDADSAVRERA